VTPLPFILDTDIGTNVDDALALAFAIRCPDVDLRAVTTVSGDTRLRARIAKKLLLLAGRPDIEVAAGLPTSPRVHGRMVEHRREGEGLLLKGDKLEISERDATILLLEECAAHHYEVATIGMQSNVAAALEREEALHKLVPRLTVMGGVFAPVYFLGRELPSSVDHNLNVDVESSIRTLNAGFQTLYVPVNVTMETWLLATHVDALRKGDQLCQALVQQIEVWSPILRTLGRGNIPDDHIAQLHDALAVACMVERSFVTTERLPVSVTMYEGSARTRIDAASVYEADVVTSVDARAFAEFWLDTVLA
jgi:purine nucleosidase